MKFRFFVDEPASGALNMAVDEALLASALSDPPLASVRLYGFRPPTVSFGYGQPLEEAVDDEACRELGIDRVRRPTGGRALLHQHELTFSVAAPSRGISKSPSVLGAYRTVNQAIRRALGRLGVPLDRELSPSEERDGSERSLEPGTPCLAFPSRHEITSGGRKIVASAQRRGPKAFLQHGVILWKVDPALWARVAPSSLAATLNAVGIEDVAAGRIDEEELRGSLRRSFEETFERPSVQGELTSVERARLPGLVAKYSSEAWTARIPPRSARAVAHGVL